MPVEAPGIPTIIFYVSNMLVEVSQRKSERLGQSMEETDQRRQASTSDNVGQGSIPRCFRCQSQSRGVGIGLIFLGHCDFNELLASALL
jgi:hypothetical protein